MRGCDPDGNFYCGSMAYDQSPHAAGVYRLAPDLSIQTVLTDVTVPNSLESSPDGSRVYYNDTATYNDHRFACDTQAGLTHGRVFAEIADRGRPTA